MSKLYIKIADGINVAKIKDYLLSIVYLQLKYKIFIDEYISLIRI